MTIDVWEALPWWQQHVYQDYLLKQSQAQQSEDDDMSGRAPDPPPNGEGTLDPFAPMLLMQQAGFTAEIAQHPNPE